MHPAKSIIAFTSLSGLGFGLMVLIGLGLPQVMGWPALVFGLLAVGLAGIGLLASLLHLGNPQRFLKAFTQWRTSWLSREAVFSMFTMMLFALHIGLLFFGIRLIFLGYLASALAVATIVCTAMIYAQLRTIPRWNTWLTPVLFLAFAITGGALVTAQIYLGLAGSALVLVVQIAHWARGRRALERSGSTAGTATALGGLGTVRMLESPHTARNYVTSEMVNHLDAARAKRLKIVVITLLVAQCLMLALLPITHAVVAGTILLHLAGVLVSRWLFFAESEHVVGLYYKG
ncbi:MAG: DmsC/YnfH family molybdoenzyme membrane anchor subunit [Paracoccaceae bacterium]